MRNRYIVAAFLIAGLFSARLLQGATDGGVRGRVLVNLQAIEGVPLTLVNVAHYIIVHQGLPVIILYVVNATEVGKGVIGSCRADFRVG